MKIKPKFTTSVDYSDVTLSDSDDVTLAQMKTSLRIIHSYFAAKLAGGNLDEDKAGDYAKVCESFTRVVEEQRKRDMLRAHIKSNRPHK